MSWFSNLFSNEAISLAIADQASVTRPEPYDAVRTKIADGVVTRQIVIIRNLVLALPASPEIKRRYRPSGTGYGTNYPWPHRKKLDDLLKLLSTTLKEVDVVRSDMKTLLRVIDLCNETLPAMFRALEIRVGQNDWETESDSLRIMEKVIEGLLEEIAVLPTKRSILTLETPTNNLTDKDFPNIESYKDHEELYASLKALRQDWEKATTLPLSAEDDYVIERAGNSYLPDALLLFDRFCHRTGSTNSGKALSIVTEQVGLIHQQVSFVLEQHEEDSFDLMEAHTEFLKTKNSRIGVPESKELELGKEPPETSL